MGGASVHNAANAATLVGGIWIVVLAFKKSVLWGIGSLIVPFVSLIFVIMNWQETKKPFLIQIAGVVLLVVGALNMSGGAMTMPT